MNFVIELYCFWNERGIFWLPPHNMAKQAFYRTFLVAFAIISCQDQGIEAFSFPSAQRTNPIGKSARHGTVQRSTSIYSNPGDKEEEIQNSRRKVLKTLSGAALIGIFGNTEAASGYDKTFPVELDTKNADMRSPREKALAKTNNRRKPASPLDENPLDLGFGAFLWGSALWFLSGSRSNPLATGVANILYDPEKEGWLKDRNDGLFGELPAPLLLVLGVMFLLIGFAVHIALISIVDGSMNISLQLSGILLISAGALEIGRIASGKKKMTREENDRDFMLEEEFDEFAEKRLKRGGNCHRNEVVKSFRRFHAKYRQADSEDYPLNDLEIEQLLRRWSRKFDQISGPSSAGFYNGIQINSDADVFV